MPDTGNQVGQIDDQVVTFVSNHSSDFNQAATAMVKASLNASDNSQLDMVVEINRTQALAKTSNLGLNLNSVGVDNYPSSQRPIFLVALSYSSISTTTRRPACL